jgi:hypothetical protein
MFEVDLDTETIWFENAWCSRDDLARKIRSMIDAGDYLVARPSQALESLTQSLANARVLPVRVPVELADALTAVAQRENRSVGGIIREALTAFVGLRSGGVPADASTGNATVPAMPAAQPAVETESVSPEEAQAAVALTPKKKDAPENEPRSDVMEKRWFGR